MGNRERKAGLKVLNTGIIFYGTDKEDVTRESDEFVIQTLKNGSPLQESVIMRHVIAQTFPNFYRISKDDTKNEITVEETRAAIEFLSQTRSISGRMVVLIQGAEIMSINAANSILKILEEPPEESVLVLTTTKLHAILPTIRSRCLKIIVNSEEIDVADFQDLDSYLKKKLHTCDQRLISECIDFITNRYMRNAVEFAKQNAENLEKIMNIWIMCSAYWSQKNCDPKFAHLMLRLQKFSNLIDVSHLDKQTALTAAAIMLTS
jgi:hypothetical protein